MSLETPNYSLQIVCSQFHVLWAHYIYSAERRLATWGAATRCPEGCTRVPVRPNPRRGARESQPENPDLSSDQTDAGTLEHGNINYGLTVGPRCVFMCLCVCLCVVLSSRCLAPRLPSIPHTPSTANSNRIMRDTARTYASGERARNTRGPHASTEGPGHTVCRRQADRDRGGGRAL